MITREAQQRRLNRILHAWETRARVRQNTLLPESLFDLNKKDFLPSWLPFYEHPIFNRQSHLKDSLLSCAWLLYNQVTIDIENEIVIPLCLSLQRELIDTETYHTLVTQTMIDESYHVLLTAHASAMTRKNRGLKNLHLPKSNLVLSMQNEQKLHDLAWQKHLIHLATCIITEVFIGAHLSVIAHCQDATLQPFNQLVTKAHMMDESIHASVFASLAQKIVSHLPKQQRIFFSEVLPKPVVWFIEGKCDAWYTILQQMGFKNSHTMLLDCRKKSINVLDTYDLSEIESLAEMLKCSHFRERLLTYASQH